MTRDVAVICTRNRRDDLESALASIWSQSRRPDATLVVDSSEGDSTQLLVQTLVEHGWESLSYRRSEPGLTIQRNVALREISFGGNFDVVHFFDDDITLDAAYCLQICRTFDLMPWVVGAGGAILGGYRGKPALNARFFLRDSLRPGVVLKSGYNIGAFETPFSMPVDWIPGCGMSFRMVSVGHLRFDENRVGYALGEDVDFGLKAGREGVLMHVGEARLVHHLSPTNRHARPRLAKDGVINRWQLALDHPEKVKRSLVLYSAVGEFFIYALRGLLKFRALQLQCAGGVAKGVYRIARSSRN